MNSYDLILLFGWKKFAYHSGSSKNIRTSKDGVFADNSRLPTTWTKKSGHESPPAQGLAFFGNAVEQMTHLLVEQNFGGGKRFSI